MFPLLETIKIIEGIPQHLHWHQQRYGQSYRAQFGMDASLHLASILQVPPAYRKGVVKARLLYGRECFKIEYSFYQKRKINSLKLLDCKDLDYALKYADRSSIQALVAQKGEADDILMLREGCITDTSYANVLFFDGKKWLTPDPPLLKGTCRARLLHEQKIFPQTIRVADLKHYQYFKLVNAMLDFEEQEAIAISAIHEETV